MSNTLEKLYAQGQSIWCDNVSRAMLDGGELEWLIGLGIVGVTSNPTIFMKAITASHDYDASINELHARGLDTMAVYEGLVIPDIVDAADQLRPVYDKTDHVDGYVSLEVNPKLAYDTQGTIDEARRLYATLNRPNVFIKVPATTEGMPAIETLIGEGINVNVTLIFSLGMHEKVMQAYLDGLKSLVKSGGDPSSVASVASFFVSRVDTLIDKLIVEAHPQHAEVTDLMGEAAIANARLAYHRFEQVFDSDGPFGALAKLGARVQRPLWASTSTKNPKYAATRYVDAVVGPNTVNTLPPATIEAVLREGSSTCSIRENLPGSRTIFEQLERLGIHIDAVTDKLLADGVAIFAKSFDELLDNLAAKQQALREVG